MKTLSIAVSISLAFAIAAQGPAFSQATPELPPVVVKPKPENAKPRSKAVKHAPKAKTPAQTPPPVQAPVQPAEDTAIKVEAAGLQPVAADKLGSAATIITGQQLQERQIRNAAEALRDVAGVSVSQQGGTGSVTVTRLRGAESKQTAVYIDGVEVNRFDQGFFDFSSLLTQDIDRIEILRGPQSGVFGANALAGVINIITKKGTGAPQTTLLAEGGSLKSYQVAANASGSNSLGYVGVSATDRGTDGFSISRFGDDPDGSRQQSVFARAGLTPTDNFRVDAMARFQNNRADADDDANFDGLPDDTRGTFNYFQQTLARVSAQLDLLDKHWSQKVFADTFRDGFFARSFDIFDGFTTSRDVGERNHYGYETTVQFETPGLGAQHKFSGLVEQRDETFTTSTSTTPLPANAARSQTGFVGEYQGEFFKQVILGGNIRRDLNEGFADATTYRATAAYLVPGSGTRLHGSYGTGITDPTFFDQFGLSPFFIPNPKLQPEQSLGWDAGIEKKLIGNRLVVDVTYFKANLTDEIATVGVPGTFDFTTINLQGESLRQGVEVQLTAKPAPYLTLIGSYTYTEATQPFSAADGVTPGSFQEIRRPKHAGALNASYSFLEGKGQLNAGLTYNGPMTDVLFDFTTAPHYVRLDDYLLLHLAASYRLSEDVTLFGRVENALNQHYEEVVGFSSAPVTAYAGVKLSVSEKPIDPPGK